jgi:hypothetical protein
MNMMDQSRMATPPAPQPRCLRRLRVASAVLCLASAIGVLGIEPIRQFSIYAVALVAIAMLGAVVTASLYWILRRRVEVAYWTPAREAARIDGVVRAIYLRRGKREGAKEVAPISRLVSWIARGDKPGVGRSAGARCTDRRSRPW